MSDKCERVHVSGLAMLVVITACGAALLVVADALEEPRMPKDMECLQLGLERFAAMGIEDNDLRLEAVIKASRAEIECNKAARERWAVDNRAKRSQP